MEPLPPLIIAVLILGRTVFSLFSGAASADTKGLVREDEPMTYWLVIIGGSISSVVLFATAYRLRNGS